MYSCFSYQIYMCFHLAGTSDIFKKGPHGDTIHHWFPIPPPKKAGS